MKEWKSINIGGTHYIYRDVGKGDLNYIYGRIAEVYTKRDADRIIESVNKPKKNV